MPQGYIATDPSHYGPIDGPMPPMPPTSILFTFYDMRAFKGRLTPPPGLFCPRHPSLTGTPAVGPPPLGKGGPAGANATKNKIQKCPIVLPRTLPTYSSSLYVVLRSLIIHFKCPTYTALDANTLLGNQEA